MMQKKQNITFCQISEHIWRIGLDDEGGIALNDRDEAVKKYKRARELAKENWVTIEMVNRF